MPDVDRDTLPGEHTQPFTPEFTGAFAAAGVLDEPAAPTPHTAAPVVVPGVPQFISRWKFVLVVAGVWIVAAAAGLGLYYWWYHALDKTMPVFVTLVYLIACIVASLLTAMVQHKPAVSAMAIAMMAAPLASTAAAAVLYGGYVFGWITR
ncbi:hypothetical protein Mycch_0572 [Mycolicibacterium chubuense NBB4]|uniref:Transmembrane protein n=1 Tax=Mycolicibacterium chubuense (strain NBB4) TaxID=710421 RepID=I4BDN3_MYCCN|nr:hypothetical protein [Mycolicibacterium chubuense]AFM15390.1 hypothetical protein Mycch_0572 [Mycolicibacterium chubuense NBB4]